MAITSGILTAGPSTHLTSSEEANGIATDFVANGVVGTISSTNGIAPTTGSWAVNAQASPNATVAVSSGVAYVTGTPTSQGSQTFRIKNSASTNVTISANASGSTKYDWVYIALNPTNLNAPNTAADNVATLVTSRSSSASADDGTPPTYGYCIAVVTVANGFSTITNSNIQDKRVRSGVTSSTTTAATTGWSDLGFTPSSATALGNRSYSLLFSSTDLTATISAGQRLRTTRTVAAPTRSTSLNGTTQYYSKTSPAGMTFTDDFVAGGWVKLSSYAASTIVSRWNGTSGWTLDINASGQVQLVGFNGGAGNNSYVLSYQSLPLNKWVHVAAQLDMSTFTASTTTSYVMIDGVDVPCSVVRGGTNPTALVQAGNLEVGSRNAGTQPLPGKLAQIFVTSAKVVQATILSNYIHQSISPTETSLISAYSFNNSINDLNTTNANNLTPNGSAVATNADSPFGGQADGTISSTLDYGIVQSVAFSTNTTVVVQVPEGCTIPTSGGVSAVSYSSNKTPYGFPSQERKWLVETIGKTLGSQASAVTSTWYQIGSIQILLPVGEWDTTYWVGTQQNGTAGGTDIQSTLATASAAETDTEFTSYVSGSTASLGAPFSRNKKLLISNATTYYLNSRTSGALAGNTLFNRGDTSPTIIRVKNAYL